MTITDMNQDSTRFELPLTDMQKTMLYECLADPTSRLYVEQLTVEIHGDPPISYIKQAWRDLFAQHPILSAHILWRGLRNPIMAEMQNSPASEITTLHMPHLVNASNRDALQYVISRRWHTVVDLETCGFEAALLIHNDRLYLVLDFHHIYLDGWSLSLLLQEFVDRLNGQPVHLLPDEITSYRTYYRQYENLRQPTSHIWRQYYAKIPNRQPITNPFKKPFTTGQCDRLYPKHRMEKLKQVAQKKQVTVASCLYYIWAKILFENTQESVIYFGVTVSGRTFTGDVIYLPGLFIHTLTLTVTRQDLTGDAFTEIRRLQQNIIELQDCISGYGEYVRSGGIPPPTHSVVTIQNYPQIEQSADRPWTLQYVDRKYNNHIAILWSIRFIEAQVYFDFSYNTSQYDLASVNLLYQRIDRFLGELIEY